jgi:hypothetical protein
MAVVMRCAGGGDGAVLTAVSPLSYRGDSHDRQFGIFGGALAHRVWADETVAAARPIDREAHLAMASLGPQGIALWLDREQVGEGALTRSSFTWEKGLVIGGHASWGAFNGDVAEILVYDRVLDESDRHRLEAAMQERYALFTGLPMDRLAAWFDADDAAAGAVTTWLDRHGGEPARPLDGHHPPMRGASEGVRFAAEHLLAIHPAQVADATGLALALAIRIAPETADGPLVSAEDPLAGWALRLVSGRLVVDGGAIPATGCATRIDDGAMHALLLERDARSLRLHLDGRLVCTAMAPGAAAMPAELVLGGIAQEVGTVLVYAAPLSPSARARWFAVAQERWRTPVAAPDPGQQLAIRLTAPLTALLPIADPPAGAMTITADITVPAGAPSDLGVGAFVADRHGRWFQQSAPGVLPPGRHRRRFILDPAAALAGEGHAAAWTSSAVASIAQAGLCFWSAGGGRADLQVDVRLERLAGPPEASTGRLLDLAADGGPDGRMSARTGERWSLSVRPDPFPDNPYDPRQFSLAAVIAGPEGERTIPGFYEQPMQGADQGDRESAVATGPGRFVIRFRPGQAGDHRISLRAVWRDGRPVENAIGTLSVEGAPWDGYVRVDRDDRRFFAVDGRPFWPIGLNLFSITDPRSRAALRTQPTVHRGTLSYREWFDRLAAGGGNACEIWLSPWNLALEWRADWNGYQGQGRYHEGNAWRLDRILDEAWARGIRINLVVRNHGQGSDNVDHEWENSPYNRRAGGRLGSAAAFFTDPWALAGQDALHRYLVARYADHPAILGWKLWSEVSLTAAGRNVVPWHQQALARWRQLDTYRHGLTTHWHGDYRQPDRAVVALPSLDYVCIDAYTPHFLPQVIADGVLDPQHGLGKFGKPVWILEFGTALGNQPVLEVETRCAGWAALVSGNAGAPLLWWHEWFDQRGLWPALAALSRFAAGEDLRGADAGSLALTVSGPDGVDAWARAWRRPGRMLGYCIDKRWMAVPAQAGSHQDGTLDCGDQPAGRIALDWWDADRGEVIRAERIDHPGGRLRLLIPAWTRHLAFKAGWE